MLSIKTFFALCLILLSSVFCLEANQHSQQEVNMSTQVNEKNSLAQCVLQGRLDVFRAYAKDSGLPNAVFKDNGKGSFFYSSGMDYAPCNGVIEDSDRIPTDQEIAQTVEFFKTRKLPFIWWTSAKKLEEEEFQFGGILTGIALDISQGIPAAPSSSPQLKVKIVQSDEDARIFSLLAADLNAMSSEAAEQFVSVNIAMMKKSEVVNFMAYLDDTPVGTASLSTFPSSAGIWTLSTLPQYRKHGIGTALVHAALVEAKKRNHDQVMAILMPKGLAWGLFAKFGFKEAVKFPFYVYGASAEELEK